MGTLIQTTASLSVLAYIIYALFVAGLTFGVARILFRNSIEFMRIIFGGRESLAIATNQLFEVGFFLFGFGIGLHWLYIGYELDSYKRLFEELSTKIGGFTLFIGALLFFNLFMFFRGMKHRRRTDTEYAVGMDKVE